jgi:outer membrane protein
MTILRKELDMRTLNLILAVAAVLSAQEVIAQNTSSSPALPAGSPFKVAYIHSQRIFQEAPGAAEAKTTLDREAAKHRADLALLADSIQNMMNDYQAKQVMLSPDAKKKQEDAIRAKNASLEQRQQQLETLMSKRQKDLIEPIMERINKTITDLRKEQGYAFVLDAASGAIISADTTLDLTGEVLKRLKAAAAPKKPGT